MQHAAVRQQPEAQPMQHAAARQLPEAQPETQPILRTHQEQLAPIAVHRAHKALTKALSLTPTYAMATQPTLHVRRRQHAAAATVVPLPARRTPTTTITTTR